MLTELLVRLLGGWWPLKWRCENTSNAVLRQAYWLIYRAYFDRKGSYIGFGSRFATQPFFPHGPRGVFISGGASIGADCTIFQHVTIGANTLADSPRHGAPAIGDRCYTGAGAKIIGKIHVGHDVRIGANCVVFQDIPDGAVVVQPAPRVIVKTPAQDAIDVSTAE